MPKYTHVDHELTPFSDPRDIMAWIERLREMIADSPDDEGLIAALHDVERIARMAGLDQGAGR